MALMCSLYAQCGASVFGQQKNDLRMWQLAYVSSLVLVLAAYSGLFRLPHGHARMLDRTMLRA